MFQDKFNRSCNRDYFQCNRYQLQYIVIMFIRNHNLACDK